MSGRRRIFHARERLDTEGLARSPPAGRGFFCGREATFGQAVIPRCAIAHLRMRLRSAIADLRRQARNPYSRWRLWIPGSLALLAPRNDELKCLLILYLRKIPDCPRSGADF